MKKNKNGENIGSWKKVNIEEMKKNKSTIIVEVIGEKQQQRFPLIEWLKHHFQKLLCL